MLSSVNPCTLCTAQAHAKVKGNCTLRISGDDGFSGLTLILANTGWIGTTLFSLAKALGEFRMAEIPALLSLNLTKIVEG